MAGEDMYLRLMGSQDKTTDEASTGDILSAPISAHDRRLSRDAGIIRLSKIAKLEKKARRVSVWVD